MNSKAKGEISEAIILARLIRLGYSVSLPFGNNQRYDLVVDHQGSLYRAQCKTAYLINGCVEFSTCSKNGFTGKRMNYIGQIEWFLVYAPETHEIYKIPVSKVKNRTAMRLRVKPNNGGATSKINWSSNYILK